MKKLKAPFLAVTLLLFGISFAIAGPTPPPPSPTARQAGTLAEMDAADDQDCFPICNPDFPIDQNIIFLIIGGLALGATVIYKNQIKKASN